MLLRFAIALSILFIFFVELNVNTFIKNYNEKFEDKIEQGVRTQAWRNLGMMEHSIRADLQPYVDKGIFITREMVFKTIDEHGQSYIGSSTGNIFVLDLEDNTLFYTNNADFHDVEKVGNKYFTEDTLYELTKKKGGDIASVKRAWNEYLIYKADNPPADGIAWNVNGEEKWLVCKTLPSTTTGFNKNNSAMGKAFQIKICQTVEKRDVLRKYDIMFEDLTDQKTFMLMMIRGLVAMFLIAVITDFVIRRYKWKNGTDRRKHSITDCNLCKDHDQCEIYNQLVLAIANNDELRDAIKDKKEYSEVLKRCQDCTDDNCNQCKLEK